MKKRIGKFKVIAKSGENKNNKKLTYKLEFELNSKKRGINVAFKNQEKLLMLFAL